MCLRVLPSSCVFVSKTPPCRLVPCFRFSSFFDDILLLCYCCPVFSGVFPEECFANLPKLHSFEFACLIFWRTHYHANASWEFHLSGMGISAWNAMRALMWPSDVVLIPAQTRHRDKFDPRQDFEVFMASLTWPGAEQALLKSCPAWCCAVPAKESVSECGSTANSSTWTATQTLPFDPLLGRSIFIPCCSLY